MNNFKKIIYLLANIIITLFSTYFLLIYVNEALLEFDLPSISIVNDSYRKAVMGVFTYGFILSAVVVIAIIALLRKTLSKATISILCLYIIPAIPVLTGVFSASFGSAVLNYSAFYIVSAVVVVLYIVLFQIFFWKDFMKIK